MDFNYLMKIVNTSEESKRVCPLLYLFDGLADDSAEALIDAIVGLFFEDSHLYDLSNQSTERKRQSYKLFSLT